MLSKLVRLTPTLAELRGSGVLGYRMASSTVQVNELVVQHSEKDREFFIELKDQRGTRTKAYLRYAPLERGLDLRSTVVPPAFEGQGVAKILAKAAFDHCAENNLKMRLTCWYLDGFLKRHPEERYTKLVI